MTQSLKESLRGCYETALFMDCGVERYENSAAAFKQSFLIILLLIPLQIPFADADAELARYSAMALVVALSYRVIISTAFFLGGVWALCWPLERKDRFYRFATAVNWAGITSYLLLLPYLILITTGTFTAVQLGNFLVFLLLYMIAIMTLIARRALQVHWAVAIMIAIGALVCEFLAATMIADGS